MYGHNIIFTRNKTPYVYEYQNESHKYYPDFVLEDGSLIEIKGYVTDKVLIKLKAVKDRPIKLLLRDDLQYAFDWVEQHYTYKQLADLYEKT